ncbi:MAG: glycosyltransferase family 2 protein [bacterium]
MKKISVIVPVFNEAEVLAEFHAETCKVLKQLDYKTEILYVDDGSSDQSLDIIRKLEHHSIQVSYISLSRNFGKELAMTAGLDYVGADAVVVIDADLQDPPWLILEFVKKWELGHDVVYGRREQRQGESWVKRSTASVFYRLITHISRTPIPEDTGDFRLMSRRAVEALKTLRERNRFMKGLFAWVGYRQLAVPYQRQQRSQGKTKWNYWKLWNFALDGITSFSTAPLRFASYLGVIVALGAFSYGAYIIAQTLLNGADVPGYPSLLVVILFLGGIQLIAIGVIGEYLGRLFEESKQRPLYLIDELFLSEQDLDENE